MVLNCENGSCLAEMRGNIEELVRMAEACDAEEIKIALKRIVPEYMPWTAQPSDSGPPGECKLPEVEKLEVGKT